MDAIAKSTVAEQSRLVALLPFVFILICAGFYVLQPTGIRIIRNAVFDQYQRWQPRTASTSDQVLIVDIDDESLKRHGQWPWPRTQLAELTRVLFSAKPALVGFNLIFSEPDRTSPTVMLDVWRMSDELRKQLASLPDHDRIFADALNQGRSVLGFTMATESGRGRMPGALTPFVVVGDTVSSLLHNFPSSLPPLPLLERSAKGNGALTFFPDVDGVVRRMPMVLRREEVLLPSFPAEVVRVAQGEQNYIFRTSNLGFDGELAIGKLILPTLSGGEIWLHYAPVDPARYIPAWKIMAGLVAPEQLQGKILLVGASAQGLSDKYFTPLGEWVPGAEIHAQTIEQTLHSQTLVRPFWVMPAELAIIVIGSGLMTIVARRLSVSLSLTVAFLTLTLLPLACYLAFAYSAILIDPLTPLLALFLTFTLSSSIHYRENERRQRSLQLALSRYLSPNLVEHLIGHPEQLVLGGQRRECSFVFTDMAGFTSFMEKVGPADAVDVLNEYLNRIVAIAFKYDGTIDRVVGDSVAVMFSAPVKQADHKQRALHCGLEILAFAADFTRQMNLKGIPVGATHIGVHSGEVVVGNVGGSNLFDYRALGDAVNTASRLQGANKHLGTTICVSETTFRGCRNIQARPVGRLLLKGKSEAIAVYHPMLVPTPADRDYAEAYRLMAAGDANALAAFERLAERYPQDELVLLHFNRLREGETGDLIELKHK